MLHWRERKGGQVDSVNLISTPSSLFCGYEPREDNKKAKMYDSGSRVESLVSIMAVDICWKGLSLKLLLQKKNRKWP